MSLWLRRGSFCETVSVETLRKHRKNWPSWNKHKQWDPFHSPFVDCDCPVFSSFSGSDADMLHRSFCTASATSETRVPLTWGGRLCSLCHSISRTVFSSPLTCLGSEVKETMLYFLCLVIFFLLDGSWGSVNVIVIYLFYNGYLAKGFSLSSLLNYKWEPLKI